MLIPKTPKDLRNKFVVVCDLYAQALELHQMGVHVVSTDEKTGIQALERGYNEPRHLDLALICINVSLLKSRLG